MFFQQHLCCQIYDLNIYVLCRVLLCKTYNQNVVEMDAVILNQTTIIQQEEVPNNVIDSVADKNNDQEVQVQVNLFQNDTSLIDNKDYAPLSHNQSVTLQSAKQQMPNNLIDSLADKNNIHEQEVQVQVNLIDDRSLIDNEDYFAVLSQNQPVPFISSNINISAGNSSDTEQSVEYTDLSSNIAVEYSDPALSTDRKNDIKNLLHDWNLADLYATFSG